MIKLNKKLSYSLGEDIYYISNYKKLNIIEYFCKDAEDCNGYETNELILAEQDGKFYLFGAGSNTNYLGFIVDKEEFLKSKNKYRYYDRKFE